MPHPTRRQAASGIAAAVAMAGLPASANPPTLTAAQSRESVQWLVDHLVRQVPARIEGDKDWGRTKSIWAGLHVERDGWRIKTHRRKKDVDHGRWIRYVVEPRLSAERGGRVEVLSVLPKPDAAGYMIDLIATATAKFEIRIQRHHLGSHLWSWSIVGHADLQLLARVSVGSHLVVDRFPPALAIDVAASEAMVTLGDLRIDRISKLGGDAADGIGEVAEEVLQKVWLPRENERLVERINAAVARHAEDLVVG